MFWTVNEKLQSIKKKVILKSSHNDSSSFNMRKLTASSLATPIFHRRRRDWRDDQYLIEDCVRSISSEKNKDTNDKPNKKLFLDLAYEIESAGYQSNTTALHLAMWIREQLVILGAKHGGYDLRVHTISIPSNLNEIILKKEKELSSFQLQNGNQLSLKHLFPDPEIRSFALERIQLLHKGSLLAYLSSLVSSERDSLDGESATIMDLIHICEEKIKRRGLKISSTFQANEVDMWVPSLKLGVEVRDALSTDNRQELIELIENTIRSKRAKYIALVCPDDLSDLIFHKWRELEKELSSINLSVLRIGDFGNYLDKLSGC
jgi:hypothetical protein